MGGGGVQNSDAMVDHLVLVRLVRVQDYGAPGFHCVPDPNCFLSLT